MKKIIFTYILLLSVLYSNAQSILKHPELPVPEKELIFFLNDNYFLNIDNYKGSIQSVIRNRTLFNSDGTINFVEKDTLQTTISKILLNNKQVIDKIGIDSIATKTNNEFELYKFDKEEDYLWGVYTLKNNIITEYNYNGAVTYSHTEYKYDDTKNINEIITTNDYGLEKIERGLTDKNNNLRSKEVFKKLNGFIHTETLYEYKNDLLHTIKTTERHHETALSKLILEHPYHLITPKLHENSSIIFNTINCSYNSNNKLAEVKKELTIINLSTQKKSIYKEKYSLNYLSNKLIVTATLPNRFESEYVFDSFGNTTQINTYATDNNQKRLQERTDFKITYQ